MDLIFKAASRPPLVFGIPLLPFLLVGGGGFLVFAWSALLLGKLAALLALLALVMAMLAMRIASNKDPHQITQYLMMIGRLSRGRLASRYWGKRCVCPIDLIKRP